MDASELKMTARREAYLNFIRDCVSHGSKPTTKEVAEEMGVGQSTAHEMLNTLLNHGLLIVESPSASALVWSTR